MSATGTQSATATTSENPPSSVTSASASPARPGLLTRTTPSPATWRTQAAVAAPSIIKLFDPGAAAAAPPSVTWWDFAFLKALYASSNDVDAWQQKGEIAHRMGKELAKVPPPPEE